MLFDNFRLCLTGSGPWLLFTSSFAFSVFQAVFWRECPQCCQQYCSAVTVCLCPVFCYTELHGTVPADGLLCSHWILAFPQTLTFSAYPWSWQAPFHLPPLSYWELYFPFDPWDFVETQFRSWPSVDCSTGMFCCLLPLVAQLRFTLSPFCVLSCMTWFLFHLWVSSLRLVSVVQLNPC